MSKLSIRKQEKVLLKLIELCEASPTPWIYHPQNFEKNFPFVEPEMLVTILAMLEAQGYIKVDYANYPDYFNIDTLEVTPAGYNYEPLKSLKTKELWKERIISFVAGFILGPLVTYFIQLILSQALSQ